MMKNDECEHYLKPYLGGMLRCELCKGVFIFDDDGEIVLFVEEIVGQTNQIKGGRKKT
jgi:hypothetical protein